MAIERISIDLDTSDPAVARLERHSYVNLINVVHAELQLIERMIGAPGALRSAIHLAEAASHAFKEARAARRHLAELARFAELTESDLQEALDGAGGDADDGDVREAVAILREVLPDAHIRVQEVIARHRLPRPASTGGVQRLSERLWGHGVQVSGAAQASGNGTRVGGNGAGEEAALPEGACLAVLMMAESGLRLHEVEIDRGPDVRLTIRGTGSAEWSAPLLRNLRPSELHAMIASGAPSLRGPMLLAYCSVPDGWVTLTSDTDRGTRLERFSLEACLARMGQQW